MSESLTLQPVDAVEVTILVDNFMDVLLPGASMVQRAPVAWDTFEREQLMAEHGLAVMVTIYRDGHSQSLLYDTGLGRNTLVHNMEVLGVNPQDFQAIVISHGHTDHHGGLAALLKKLGKRRIPLVIHPDAWLDRKMRFPTGKELHLPPPSRADMEREGVEVLERRVPSLLINDAVLVTGQVERVTEFEKGAPGHYAQDGSEWTDDRWIWDDQAIMVNVRDRGLVVVSGCSHSGIINVLRYAQHLTGVRQVYGVMGGFHLSGAFFEKIIPPTVDELETIAPTLIMPCHCTGWKAVHEIARRLPDAYVQACVGTRLCLSSQAA
jgi:7,8-dihydropterin-6-yl-methyl-4-(beta-D-ribofuranosyl)aminobenzene 5'-phosphate synthase